MRFPHRAIDLARQELQRRLAVPKSDVGARQRARLQSRLARLGQLYSWGDMTVGGYRREVQATRDLMAVSPDESKVVAFDRHWRVIDSMPENIERATPGQREELVRLLVERVESRDGRIVPDSVVERTGTSVL